MAGHFRGWQVVTDQNYRLRVTKPAPVATTEIDLTRGSSLRQFGADSVRVMQPGGRKVSAQINHSASQRWEKEGG
jgi:hypothetical protein